MKKSPSFHSITWNWELMQRSQQGFHSQQHTNLDYLTTAACTKCLLPDPAFKDLCLQAVAAACSHRNECEMCCHVNVTRCPCRELRQALRLSCRGFSLQSFSLSSPGLSSDTSAVLLPLCVFTSLSSSKAGWRFLVL